MRPAVIVCICVYYICVCAKYSTGYMYCIHVLSVCLITVVCSVCVSAVGVTMSGLLVGGWGMGVGQQFPETMNPIYSLKTVSIASPAHKAF